MPEHAYTKVFRSRVKGALAKQQITDALNGPHHITTHVRESEHAYLCDYCKTANYDEEHKQCRNCGAPGIHQVYNTRRICLQIRTPFGTHEV